MDCLNYITQLVPGIFISDSKARGCETKLENLNIKYLININNTLDGKPFVSYNLSVDTSSDFYNSSSLIDIDLDKTNDFIISALQNNSNILICDESYNTTLLIIGAFLIKFLKMSLTESIYWITKKSNVSGISKNICYQLFLFFQKNDST
jgi:hypothetical protein